MSSYVRINASVYSRIGYGRVSNTNSFYMNGKFTSENHIENVQASMENRGSDYLFALADNMICENPEQDFNISILKELEKLHEKISVNDQDIYSSAKELENRVNDVERLISSFLEMNRVNETDSRWNMGFSGLLFSDGQFVALTGGNGRVYMMREGIIRPLASDTEKAKRAIDMMTKDDEESEEIKLPGQEIMGSVIVSDVSDIMAGDSFVLLSHGVMEALGEERIEDLFSLQSDSSHIAYRMVDEAMKRNSSGDLTAMVIQVEKIYEGKSSSRSVRQKPQSEQKKMVDRFSKVPPVTYKYNKNTRRSGKSRDILYVIMVILTVIALFVIVGLMISSLMKAAKKNITTSPTPSPTTSVTPTITPYPEEPTESPTQTPEDTEEPGEIIEHKVRAGESLSGIVRKYYGDTSLLDKLCKYNNIEDPNKISVDQIIKIPPREVLAGQ
jgi:LysM repeat protein/serine/threonine protein phosphatase PrpC